MTRPLRSTALALGLAALASTAAPALAWGKTGHRIVGAIADRHLGPEARAEVMAILGKESLAEASTWPDFQKSDPSPYWQDIADPWHYATAATAGDYKGPPKEGDALSALAQFGAVVRDASRPLAERQAALRFIVHIVGDLHQPLHVGRPGDRGGNDVAVAWFRAPTNLHSVWDSRLVDDEQLSYSEKADWLIARLTPERMRAMISADPRVWMANSIRVRETLYPAADTPTVEVPGRRPGDPPQRVPDLGYRYIWQHQASLDDQLARGGLNLAAYLNRLFQR